MAGKKHHFIPQFLIRSFSISGKGKNEISNIYSRTRGTFQSTPQGIGSERHFYEINPAEPDSMLDSKITKIEEKMASYLNYMRSSNINIDINSADLSEILIHLCVRGSHIRESFTHGFVEMVYKTSDTFSNPAEVRRLLKIDESMPSRIVMETLRSEWQKNKTTLKSKGLSQSQFEHLALSHLRNNFSATEPLLGAFLNYLTSDLAKRANDVVRKSHLQSLDNSLAPELRVDQISRFSPKIVEFPDFQCVLPDCISLGFTKNNEILPIIFCSNADLIGYIFPISHKRIIVSGDISWDLLYFEKLQDLCIFNSWDFVISAAKNDHLNNSMQNIGSHIRAYLNHAVGRTKEIG